MGWKSTQEITRQEAIGLIILRLYSPDTTGEELANAVEAMGYGENSDLPLYGHNFCITDD